LENNEVEFIMYGLSTPGANYAAAMTELFAFSFAVNFIEAFTQEEVRAFGKFMWVAAIVYALKETIIDMDNFLNEKDVQFFGDFIYSPEYKDYLRLFLFVHLEGKKVSRTMALIEQNTDSDLTAAGTYIEATTSSSVKLWFLPGVTEMVGKTGILEGKVIDNHYIIEKETIYSY